VALMPYAQPRVALLREEGSWRRSCDCRATQGGNEDSFGLRAGRRVVTSHHQATKQSSEMASRRYASPRHCRAGLEAFGAISPAPGFRANLGRQPLTDKTEKGKQWKRCFGVVHSAVKQPGGQRSTTPSRKRKGVAGVESSR
jgi:hypothetical protein